MNNSERHAIIPAIWMFIFNDQDEVFLLKRHNTGWRDGSWTVPAGHIEAGEGPARAAIRELDEEAGLTVDASHLSDPLVYFYPADDQLHERVSVFYKVSGFDGTPVNNEPDKASEAGWFKLDELPQPVVPLLRRALVDYRNGVRYSERFYDKTHFRELLQ